MNTAAIRISVLMLSACLTHRFLHSRRSFSSNHFRASAASGVIEVSDRRFRERLAECRHAMLPLLFPDHREPFDVGEVFDVELDVLPQRASIPAVETGHVEQHAQFSVLPDESLELGHKVLVIRFASFPLT